MSGCGGVCGSAPKQPPREVLVAKFESTGYDYREVLADAVDTANMTGLPDLRVDVGPLRIEEVIMGDSKRERVLWEADVFVYMEVKEEGDGG